MRLWFDGQSLQTGSRYRGIGRYVGELLYALSQRPDVEIIVSFNSSLPSPDVAWIGDFLSSEAKVQCRWWQSIVVSGEAISGNSERRRVSALALSHQVACLSPDIAISASPFEGGDNGAVPLEPLEGFPVPVTSIFYDAIPYRFPSEHLTYPRKRAFYERRLGMHKSFAMNFAISEFCRQEARVLFPSQPALTISTGVSQSIFGSNERSGLHSGQDSYVLYVGGLDWRKNVPVVIDAFKLLPTATARSLRFVIAGKTTSSETRALAMQWSAAGLAAERLVFTGHVTDEHLRSLYQGCAFLVQPSRMEGFGLTAAEAMLAGVPVVGGNAGALPEVIGSDQLLFDPDRPDELAAIMTKLLDDKAFRADAIAHGQRQASQFTWERTAGLLVDGCRDYLRLDARPRPDLSTAREWTLAHARKLDLPSEWIAGLLARAEAGALDGARPR